MAKITDPHAGVPGGYFLHEDGETVVDAYNRPRSKLSDAELEKHGGVFAKKAFVGEPVARVVTVTQAELDRERKQAADAIKAAREAGDDWNADEMEVAESQRVAQIEADRLRAEADAALGVAGKAGTRAAGTRGATKAAPKTAAKAASKATKKR